ncbi:VanZ family protein [Clostridium sp.]|uniref:VanZ family protein n=1 Tax=Clostridium sp. TaxID=1506 RepID=UPI001D84794D|nr:VanZ family protein [Clostridium sp.]MBS5985017.1 VanZ family protein [Clostridium sp.]
MNIVPVFNTIKDIYEVPIGMESYMVRFWIKNILGNILLLLPLGIFLPMCFKRLRSFKSTVITCALVSLSIEVVKYISMYFGNFRSCDIDDIILNTLGGMIGFIIYKVINKKVDLRIEF